MTTGVELLAMIRTRARWPSTNAPVSDANLLLLSNDEIASVMWPWLLASQGDYYTTYQDAPITANKTRYRLPDKAFGPIKGAWLVDVAGVERPMSFCGIAELGQDVSTDLDFTAFFDGDLLGLTPTPKVTDGRTLRIRYYRRPNLLNAAAAEAGTALRVIGTLTSATRLTLTSNVAGSVFGAGRAVDIISQGGNHQVLAESLVITAAGTATLDFASYPDVIAAGDHIVDAGLTSLVQLPDYMVPLLAQRVAMIGLDIEGDSDGFERKLALVAELKKEAIGTMQPRQEGEPRMTQPRGTPHRPGR